MSTPDRRQPKALLVGIDGFNLDRIDHTSTVTAPTVRRLRDKAVYAPSRIYPDGETMTVSGPGWSTILTGVWPDKHKVLDNTIEGNHLTGFPDLLTRADRAGADVGTYYLACWQPLYEQILTTSVDYRYVLAMKGEWPAADRKIAAVVTDLLRGSDHDDLGFVYFGSLDEEAHTWGAESPQYDAAITAVDGYLATILATIDARPTRATEDWLIAITTDHGHRPEGGHGGQTDAERSTFTIWSADGSAAGPTDAPADAPTGGRLDGAHAATSRMVDLAPTLLAHVGIEPDPAWDLDGRSVLAANDGSA